MVGGAEWPGGDQGRAAAGEIGATVEARRLDGFREGQVGQDGVRDRAYMPVCAPGEAQAADVVVSHLQPLHPSRPGCAGVPSDVSPAPRRWRAWRPVRRWRTFRYARSICCTTDDPAPAAPRRPPARPPGPLPSPATPISRRQPEGEAHQQGREGRPSDRLDEQSGAVRSEEPDSGSGVGQPRALLEPAIKRQKGQGAVVSWVEVRCPYAPST
jgi:hypothetical protein